MALCSKLRKWCVMSVKLHLRDKRTNGRTDKETNTHGNNVHHDRRRHAVSTSLRLVDPLQKTRLCPSVRIVVVVVVVVDLYSASRRASSAPPKWWVFSADLKPSVLRAGSRSECGSEFHSIGPAMEKARRPHVLRRCRGIINWWRLADLRR